MQPSTPESTVLEKLLPTLLRALLGLLLTTSGACAGEAQEPSQPSAPLEVKESSRSLEEASPEDSVVIHEPTWTPTGHLALGRLLHRATPLPDGRVLVVGGYNRTVEVYDPATEAWTRAGDALNTYRSATATLLEDGQVLVAGAGGSGWDSRISASLYDADTGTWRATGNMVTPRFHHTATLLRDGRVLVTGGVPTEYGTNAVAVAEVYDPTTVTWVQTGALSIARRDHTATLLADGRVLVTGGTDGSGMRQRAAEVYDPASGAWSRVQDMGTARTLHTATLMHDGQVLVVGGGGSDRESSASVELFEPASNTWASAVSLSQPRRQHSATLLPTGHVVVAGGFHELTGIQSAAEVYDAATRAWRPAGTLTTDRYGHTASLLHDGRLLLVGGFSNTDQSSTEMLQPHFQNVLAQGQGWKLTAVAGVTETGEAYSANLYMVQGEDGIAQAPLPPTVQTALAESIETEDLIYMLDQRTLDEIRLSEEQGEPTPGLRAIAEQEGAARVGEMGLVGGCGDTDETFGQSFHMNIPFQREDTNVEGLSGSVRFTGSSQTDAWGELKFRKLRTRVLSSFCIPYGAVFKQVRVHGSMAINTTSELEGTLLNYTNPGPWELELDKWHLFSRFFFIGQVPVYMAFNMPVTVGAELSANVTTTGTIAYWISQLIQGSFDYSCTSSNCWGTSSFQQSVPSSPGNHTSGAFGSLRLQPSLYVQLAVRGYVYNEGFAYAQVGVRPYVHGDLWAYGGNACGDADGDGFNEVVGALTLDVDAQVNLTAQASILRQLPWRWDDLWSSPRHHLVFWELAGSSALRPMLGGAESATVSELYTAQARMRPCWPYADSVTYSLDWGDGTSDSLSGAPSAWQSAAHSWTELGSRSLLLTAVRDSHGRELNKGMSRTVTVMEPVDQYFDFSASDTNHALRNTVNHPVTLHPGQTLTVSTCALPDTHFSGDTYLRLASPTGQDVAANDDSRNCGTGSHLVYTVPPGGGGTYTIKAGCYASSSCNGRVGYRR